MTDSTFLVANTSLAAEEFDGETVLIDVTRGLYFSLGGSATELWRAFSEQRSEVDVVDTLCLQLAGADRAGLTDAIRSMRDNGLLLPVPEASSVSPKKFMATSSSFALPVVEVYSDLADLIAIDPVHEVNASAGWPMRPENFPSVA